MKSKYAAILCVVAVTSPYRLVFGQEQSVITHELMTPQSVFNSKTIETELEEGDSEGSARLQSVSYFNTYDESCSTFQPNCCDTGCSTTGGCCDDSSGHCTNDCLDDVDLSCLKNQPLCGDWKWSSGIEIRYRYMNEINRLRPAGEVRRDTYDLWRITPYVEVGNDWISGYAQAIDASIFNEDLDKLPNDEDRSDMLQYYVDVKVWQGEGSLRARYGRQFLKYGSQHLISPLAWSNTYRTFEGGKVYYDSRNWILDGFAVNPSNGAASPQVFRPTSRDTTDESLLFSGLYATYKNAPNGSLDLYWLFYDEDEPQLNRQDGRRHTIGMRYAGQVVEKDNCQAMRTWTWDFEGAYQFGEDSFQSGGSDLNVSAGFVSAIAGLTFNNIVWSPTVTGLFWWGSGDDDPNDGTTNTVNTLFPLGHAYWGQIDNFNGSNLIDYSIQGSVQPSKKLNLAAQWHWFDKASANDYVYNIANAPLGNTTTPERQLGTELDLVATYAVNSTWNLQLGYFWFWYGDAVDDNAGIARRDDAEQVYLMSTMTY